MARDTYGRTTQYGRRDDRGRRYAPMAYYTEGSAARQLEPEREERRRRRPRQQKRPVRYEKRVSSYDLKYTLFLIGATVMTLGSCFCYLHASAGVTATQSQIASLQEELTEILEVNNALTESMNTPIDLEEVYRKATTEFGMVYADESQIIYYDSSAGDYIRQYEDIPDR